MLKAIEMYSATCKCNRDGWCESQDRPPDMPVNRDDDDGDQCKVDGDDDHLRLWLKTKSSFDQNSTINLLSTADGKTVVAALSK